MRVPPRGGGGSVLLVVGTTVARGRSRVWSLLRAQPRARAVLAACAQAKDATEGGRAGQITGVTDTQATLDQALGAPRPGPNSRRILSEGSEACGWHGGAPVARASVERRGRLWRVPSASVVGDGESLVAVGACSVRGLKCGLRSRRRDVIRNAIRTVIAELITLLHPPSRPIRRGCKPGAGGARAKFVPPRPQLGL